MPEIASPFRYELVAFSSRAPLTLSQHPVSQDSGDLTNDLVRVFAEVVFDPEDDLDGEVVVENARGQHHRRDRRKAVLKPACKRLLHAVLLHEGIETTGHIGVELPDVGAVEFDDVDVDEGDVFAVVL